MPNATTALSSLEEKNIEALSHDDSDAEGNPGLSVWDIPSGPKTPSTVSKKAVKRKYEAVASSSPLPAPFSTSSPAESKTVDTAPTSPVASPDSELCEKSPRIAAFPCEAPPKMYNAPPKMSNAPPRYEPVKKKARKADGLTGKSKGKATPEPKTESKTGSKPTTTPKKQPKITQRRVAKDPHRPAPPPVAISTAANDALSDDDPAKLWCHCRTPMADLNMILCDNKECRVGWYHMDCVRVKGEPAGWVCAACKGRRRGGEGG